MNTAFKSGISLSLLLLTWLVVGGFIFTSWVHPSSANAPRLAPQYVSNLPMQGFADLVERVQPAVVNVSAQRRLDVATRQPQRHPFSDFFQEFFGAPGARSAPGLQRPLPPSQALPPKSHGGPGYGSGASVGSGFIVDESGLVVTNHHVVEGAMGIKVTLQDGRSIEAELVGSDPKTDIAVLRLAESGPFPALTFGDSDITRVGDWVVAIGNPFGLGGTVTTGIVSARGRDIQAGPYDDFLQIDAPINQGNSGGPLFNTAGEVIGINTAIYSPHGGSVGIGFAIPASLANPIIADLRQSGTVQRGWLGVTIQPVTEAIAQSLGIESDEATGVIVAQVVPGSPADEAGLKQGDVIQHMNQQPLNTGRDLSRAVAQTEPGDKIDLQVWRRGDLQTLTVRIAQMPNTVAQAGRAMGRPSSESKLTEYLDQSGLKLAELDDRLRARLRLPAEEQGVVITAVAPGSPAHRRGLRAGDRITQVAQQPVASLADLQEILNDGDRGDSLLLLVNRAGNSHFVAIPVA